MDRILVGPAGAPACEILIEEGLVDDPDAGLVVPPRDGRTRIAVLTQPGRPAVYARSLGRAVRDTGLTAEVRVVPDRDAAKTLATAEEAYTWLNGLALTRDDLIVGVGGGAVTDLAGFVGATYLRGVDVVYVPTTLLAAVDAAIGGKTGVNIGGKNLVGAFHHPVRVVIDPGVIAGLPDELIVEGTAEALKAGLVGDPELVALYETHGIDAPLDEVVARAVRVKAGVVSADFTEQGTRAVLNYGHTVGHGVEMAAALPHGHAVAIGMVAAGRASEIVTGFTGADRQRDLIGLLGLPTAAPGLAASTVRSFMALDKKRSAEGLRMTLLETVGRATVTAVDDATVRRALEAVGIT